MKTESDFKKTEDLSTWLGWVGGFKMPGGSSENLLR
jgi:hypothetical protein